MFRVEVAKAEEAVGDMLVESKGGKEVEATYSRSSRSFFCSTALSTSWWAKYLRIRGM